MRTRRGTRGSRRWEVERAIGRFDGGRPFGDVLLPGEVRAGGGGDRFAKLVVGDAGDLVGELGRKRGGGRDAAGDASLGRAGRGLDRADAEAELADLDAGRAKAREERVAEHRELAGPDARGGADRENAALEGGRLGPIGDASADRFAPDAGRDRIAMEGEAIFAGAADDAVDRLGGAQVGSPSSSLHERGIADLQRGAPGGGDAPKFSMNRGEIAPISSRSADGEA